MTTTVSTISRLFAGAIAVCLLFTGPLLSQEAPEAPGGDVLPEPGPGVPASPEAAMTLDRMGEIVRAIDPDAQVAGPGFTLTIDDIPVLIVTDAASNRMRAMVPIRSADEMTEAELFRVMQANFDSALDARYAIAQGRLWGVFIHPLAELERDQFISGLAQTVNIAKTYGTLYQSGGVLFGRGDSGDLQQQLLKELLERGQDI